MDHRGVESSVPYSDRSGYQGPQKGWLEQHKGGVYLLINGVNGTIAVHPGRYLVVKPYGSNVTPRVGIRSETGSWAVPPEPVLVDFLSGYHSTPVVLGGMRYADDTWIDTPDDLERVAAQYQTHDAAGQVTNQIQLEACVGGAGNIAVTATGAIELVSGAGVSIDCGAGENDRVALAGASSTQFLATGSATNTQFEALAQVFAAWVPVPSDGGAALKTLLTALLQTWPGDTSATKVTGV